jgi:hypothetical protein
MNAPPRQNRWIDDNIRINKPIKKVQIVRVRRSITDKEPENNMVHKKFNFGGMAKDENTR